MRGKQASWRGVRRLTDDVLFTLVLSLAVGLVAELLFRTLDLTRVGVLFLAPVAVTGTMRGSRAAVIAALINVALYRVFLQYRIDSQASAFEDLLNASVFLLIALLTGTLAGRVREEAERSRMRALTMERLFDVSRSLLDAADEDAVWQRVTHSLSLVALSRSVVGVDYTGMVRATAGSPDRNGIKIARAALTNDNAFESGSDQSWQSARLVNGDGLFGTVAWLPGHAAEEPQASQVEIVLQIGAAALERERSARIKLERDSLEESNRLREALLSSISHDFRSPLAAIIGSASSLLEYGDKFTREVTRDLLENIHSEGDKLNRYVGNLLNMIRLQAGCLNPETRPTVVSEIVEAVCDRLRRHKGKEFPLHLTGDCRLIADPLLFEQALYNVLDNAIRYGNADAGIEIDCHNAADSCIITIADHGPGLTHDDARQAFDKFYIARKGAGGGTGLGLSIVKGFIEAMGGTIQAGSREDGKPGLALTLTVPRAS